jgi:hypothetical protein
VWHLKIQKTADFKQSSDAPGEAPGVLHVLKNMKRRDDLKPLPDLAIEKLATARANLQQSPLTYPWRQIAQPGPGIPTLLGFPQPSPANMISIAPL